MHMNRPPADTREQPDSGFGEVHVSWGSGPGPPPVGVDHGPRVPRHAAPRPRHRPDYRLRGLDLGVQSLYDARTRPTRRAETRRRRRRRFLVRLVVVLTIATGAALLVRALLVQPFSVSSAAMTPTLQVGDQVLVVKSSLLAGPIQRGNIVVFRHPNYFPCRASGSAAQDLVKRVVGLPHETIWSTGNKIYVDRHQLNEQSWYDPTFGQVGSKPILRTKIPPGDYFMMGDNRTDSCDSRSFGAISGSSIVGEVKAIVLRNGHPHFHLLP
jgi:signal peptidase I